MADDRVATYADGTTVRTITYDDGSPPLVTTTPPPGGTEANRQAIVAKARLALDLNATFLALNSPTTAQGLAQVKLLTREVNALIRMRLGNFDTTSGT